MNSHADKTHDSKRQPVVKSVSQDQNKGLSDFQIDDNRAEAIAQRKVQQIANNSNQVKQMKAVQKIANSTSKAEQTTQMKAIDPKMPIQKKALNAGVLNVAGEHHDKSDKLRIWEEDYAREKTGGAYWQEDEFKFSKQKPKGNVGETVSVHGDPKILQMANVIHFCTKSVIDINRYIDRLTRVKATKFNLPMNRSLVFDTCKLVNNHLPKLRAFRKLFKKLQPQALSELPNQPDYKGIYDFYSVYGNEFFNDYVSGVKKWVSATLELDQDKTDKDQLNNAAKGGLVHLPKGKSLINKLFLKEDVSAVENQEGLENVIYSRSKAMHEAATAGKASKGVWKVGETHVSDIKDEILEDANPDYELMTDKEFYVDFNKWLEQDIHYQGMLYGLEIAHIYGWSDSVVLEKARAGEFDAMVHTRRNRGPVPSYIV